MVGLRKAAKTVVRNASAAMVGTWIDAVRSIDVIPVLLWDKY
jgi:hypothetical protein